MKKIHYLMLSLLAVVAIAGCNKEEEGGTENGGNANVVATVSQSNLVEAVASMYAAWEESTTIPETLTVDGKDLTLPQYQYAMCKFLVDIKAGSKNNIDVLSYKAADHPDRDSYDMETIPVTGGDKNNIDSDATEDLTDIARRMIAAMEKNGQVPNQTLFTRAEAIAFSTNRATVTMARAIAAYKADGKFPASVSTEYLSAAATMKAFAQQVVSYLDVWEKTTGTLSADGSHNSGSNTAWENVHFIPIPYSGGYSDGKDQYADEFKPYHTITIEGREYTAAECWDIAARGIVDLLTKEGSTVLPNNWNQATHTPGVGKTLSMPIPVPDDWATSTGWGEYPWYEKADDPAVINFSDANPADADFLIALLPTYLWRCSVRSKITNFQLFNPAAPSSAIAYKEYFGNISPMRTFLIMLRFYKHILDNNITENFYEAVKDVKLSYDLYGVAVPDITIVDGSVTVPAAGTAVSATFNTSAEWTATPSESWIHVDPSSGKGSGQVTINISADNNTGAARSGKVVIKGGNVTDGLEITVNQAAFVEASTATLKEWAQAFVKGLDVWAATVGNIDADGVRNSKSEQGAWLNVHYIPIGNTNNSDFKDYGNNQYSDGRDPWTFTVGGVTYTSSQAWEIAIRGLMNMVTAEGEAFLPTMDDRNKAYTLADNAAFSTAAVPTPTDGNKWGKNPWYEYGQLVTDGGKAIETVDIEFMVKVGAWHVVRSFVKTSGNTNPLGAVGNFQEFGSKSSQLNLGSYAGLISPMRELLVLMRIYKYLLDNNIDKNVYTAIKDQKFDFDLYGEGLPAAATLKVWAQEFVKGLDVWEATVGTVDADGKRNSKSELGAWTNVHYIPIGNTNNSDFKDYGNNQYSDGKEAWSFTVGDVTYTSSQAWEIAIRGLMNMVTAEGEAFLPTMDDRNKAYTLADNAAFSTATIPSASEANKWGKNPWYEYENLVTDGGKAIESVDVEFMVKVGAWHVVRSFVKTSGNTSPLGAIGNFQEFGSKSGQLNLGSYSGYISPMRELLVLMRMYKYMIDNNVDKNVYTAIKDQKFDFDLYKQGK